MRGLDRIGRNRPPGPSPRGRAILVCLAALGVTLLASPASAQIVEELASIRAEFEYGRFEDSLEHAQLRIDQGSLTPEQLAELHKLAGLSAFNLGNTEDAERHLLALIRLNPDYVLDPYAVPPPAMKFFDKLKITHAEELEIIRQARRTEQLAREAAAREEARRKEEEQRRRLEELSRRVTLRTVEKKAYLVNFLPFGLGQFQQGRNGTGIVLAATQGAVLTTTLVSYFAFHSFVQHTTLDLTDFDDPDISRTGPLTVDFAYIPRRYEVQARNWRTAHYVSAYAFVGIYAIGVLDALWRHRDEVITTTIEEPAPGSAPASKTESLKRAGSRFGQAQRERMPLTLQPYLTPLPGGAGAGVTVHF